MKQTVTTIFLIIYLVGLVSFLLFGKQQAAAFDCMSQRTDEYGNQFRYRAKLKDAHGSQLGRWAWDVFLLVSP